MALAIAAGLLYPFTGWLLSPMLAAAMSLNPVSVIASALRLRAFPTEAERSGQAAGPAAVEAGNARD